MIERNKDYKKQKDYFKPGKNTYLPPKQLPRTGPDPKLLKKLIEKNGIRVDDSIAWVDVSAPDWYVDPLPVADPRNFNVDYRMTLLPDEYKKRPEYIIIPRAGMIAPVEYVRDEFTRQRFKEGKIKRSEYQDLFDQGAIHIPGTAYLGQNGVRAYFGHSSYTRKEETADKNYIGNLFVSLPLVQKDDIIYVVQKKKSETVVRTYKVSKKELVAADAVDVLDQERIGKKIALGTCVPIGGKPEERLMVYADEILAITYDYQAASKAVPQQSKQIVQDFVKIVQQKKGVGAPIVLAIMSQKVSDMEQQLNTSGTIRYQQERLKRVLEYVKAYVSSLDYRSEQTMTDVQREKIAEIINKYG